MVDIRINDEVQSLAECRKSIQDIAIRINNDISSTMINQGRIDSLRALLDLFEEYNKILIEQKEKFVD